MQKATHPLIYVKLVGKKRETPITNKDARARRHAWHQSPPLLLCQPVPWVLLATCVGMVVAFAWNCVAQGHSWSVCVTYTTPLPNHTYIGWTIPYQVRRTGSDGHAQDARLEMYRLLGYVFGHHGLKHLLGNVTFLLMLGGLLSIKHSQGYVGLVLVAGAVVGACTFVSARRWQTGRRIGRLVGASAAGFGLLGACLVDWVVDVLNQRLRFHWIYWFLLTLALWVFGVREVAVSAGADAEGDGIAHSSHLGGALGGAAVAAAHYADPASRTVATALALCVGGVLAGAYAGPLVD